MKILLQRRQSTPVCTIGLLSIDGVHECYTCEDVVRAPGVKVYGQTAIPAGIYPVVVNLSQRFKRRLPLLLNVPGFEGVRIHPGNTAADTEGCILPGRGFTGTGVTQSVLAFDALFLKIEAAHAAGQPVSIEIRNAAER